MSAERDPYGVLAPIYDAAWGDEDLAVAHPWVCEALGNRGGIDSFVDVGCGTGKLLALMQERREARRLEGVDASAAMLKVARSRLPSSVRLSRADVRDWHPRRRYDLVGCFGDVLSHMREPGELVSALSSLRGALRPGGRLLLSVSSGEPIARWRASGLYSWPLRRGAPKSSIDATTVRLAGPFWKMDCDVRHAGRRIVISTLLRRWIGSELWVLLGTAGLVPERMEERDGRLLWVARRSEDV